MPSPRRATGAKKRQGFDLQSYLTSDGPMTVVRKFRKGEKIFSQGDAASDVFYIQQGEIRLSVLSKAGKEAVVALLVPGDFFGEAVLARQSIRIATASAAEASSVLAVSRDEMIRLLHAEQAFADRFLSHMLSRNIRIESDLVDQLFNSSEKRLARTLLLLARYGDAHPRREVPKVSQDTLAEMIGSTRSRVNFFMNKFRKLGFIEYNGTLKVNSALLSVVLHD